MAGVHSRFPCTLCSPGSDQDKEVVSGSETGVHVYERVRHQVHSIISLAPHEVDTDEKKHECFLNGLNDGLAYALEARDFENFQGMVNKALVLENRRAMERKHKLVRQHQSSSSSKPRVATSSARPMFRPAQP
jgi:hypothetical protein